MQKSSELLNKRWCQTTNCDVYLIRHGLSLRNDAFENAKNQKEAEDIIKDPKFIDVSLNENGFKQAQSLQNDAKKLDIKLVFVSPLRRTIQTTINIFKTHPNKSKIIFKIIPYIRESTCSSDDIPCCSVEQLKEEFQGKEGINFDFSQIEGDQFWILNTICNEERKKLLTEKSVPIMRNPNLSEKQKALAYQQLILNEQKATFPLKYEIWSDIYKRAQSGRPKLKKILEEYQLVGKGQACLVAHCEFLVGLTAKGIDKSKKENLHYSEDSYDILIDPICFTNCEVHPFNL